MTDQKKHRKEIKKWLEVKYTEVEISEKSMELARKTGELRTAEENKKSVMSQLKSEIDSLAADTNKLGGEIIAGGEFRNVKCEVEYNYETVQKSIIRLDTMEVVYDGPIPDEERQIEMSEPEKGLTDALDKEDENDEWMNYSKDKKDTSDEQSPVDEPNDTAPPQSDTDAPQTEESEDNEAVQEEFKNKVTEETQAELDLEDEKIKKKILIAQGSVK